MVDVTRDWLLRQNRRCILVECTINKLTSTFIGTDTPATGTQTLYYSNTGFITENGDAVYQPYLRGNLKFSEILSDEGGISMSFGDVELSNTSGMLDAYLDDSKYIWDNGTVKVYLGSPSWPVSSKTDVESVFELVFTGMIAGISSRDTQSINISVRDKLQRLNTNVTENKIGTYGTWGSGNQTNKDNIKPLVFGEVFNITPVLINPAPASGSSEYMVNDGPFESLVEVRDNGVPITPLSVNNTLGTFIIDKPLVGNITATVQGVTKSIVYTLGSVSRGGIVPSSVVLSSNTYTNNLISIVLILASQYGKSSLQLLLSNEIDVDNIVAFDLNNTNKASGIFITDRENTLDICNQLMASIGAQLYMNRIGKLQILRYGSPTSITPIDITPSSIILNSLVISDRSTVRAATKLGFAKNWTVQSDLVTAIPQAHKDSYATEWVSTSIVDSAVASVYKLYTDPVQKDTYLIVESEAIAEATRLNALYTQVRTIYSFKGTPDLARLKLGQSVNLTHPRFGLNATKSGQVVGITIDWLTFEINVDVLVFNTGGGASS